MSRHRNVRSMNYSDEYDGYDDVYGHSVEDDYTISPSDAAFMYDRNHQPQMSAFLAEEDDIAEEDESELDGQDQGPKRRDSETFQRPQLSDIDEARLLSCIEEIRNVIGDTVSEQALVDTILKHDFSLNKSLDAILSSAASSAQPEDTTSKRQREKKDTGKDQDENQSQLQSKKDSDEITSIQRSIANLAIQKSATSSFSASSIDFKLSNELGKTLKIGSANKITVPKFQFKSNPKYSKEESSDDDDDEGSLSALMSKHKSTTQSTSKQFSSLTDLANQHLKSKPLNINIAFGSKQHSSDIQSLNKSNQVKESDQENDLKIDLSCALKPSSSRTSNTKVTQSKTLKFQSDSVDDSVAQVTQVSKDTFDCALNATHIMNARVPQRKEVSAFGKVVCRRWHKRVDLLARPPVRDALNEIKCFTFNTPSPDDVIRFHLHRK